MPSNTSNTSNTSNSNSQSTSASNQAASSASHSSSSGGKPDYRMIKDAGFNNMNHMMQSYGLKMHNHEDIQEAKAILDGYRKIDEAASQKK
jgi:hypothetical protein